MWACVAVCASFIAISAAHGQTWDGSLLWNNNDNTLTGQYTGMAGAGAPACASGFSAYLLGTTTYTHNHLADPLLSGALNIAYPNFQPLAGSPAYKGNAPHGLTVSVSGNDPWFDKTCFTGAVGPNAGDDWTLG
jgi:hypothetical protein